MKYLLRPYSAVTLLLCFLFNLQLLAQTGNGTIIGTTTDKETAGVLPFVSVVVKNSSPVKGITSDTAGRYILTGMKPGRYSIVFSCIGYKTYTADEVLVFSGKAIQLNAELYPTGYKTGEITVTGSAGSKQPVNSMAGISARSLSIEEASRFAGGYDDPARLVTAFAGTSGGLQSNGISVRGNAPGYLQWKLEGTEIPNPNHFADLSVFGGGGLTALSSNLLKSSDFLTGAFPAEYGNALSGVLDLQMRSGNAGNYEHTFQAGLAGIEFASEGPLNKSGASYLVNYRYSTLGLLAPLLPEDADGTKYQDLSFKFHYPAGNNVFLSLWGIGLNDNSGQEIEKDASKRLLLHHFQKQDALQNSGAAGLSAYVIGERGYSRTSVAFTFNETKVSTAQLYNTGNILPLNYIFNGGKTIELSTVYNVQVSTWFTLRAGAASSLKLYSIELRNDTSHKGIPELLSSAADKALLNNAYVSASIKAGDFTNIITGLHIQHFGLNNKIVYEPRFTIVQNTVGYGDFSLGFGLHSRTERLQYYFIKDSAGRNVNTNLDFTKAMHFVAGWQYKFGDITSLKTEVYLQNLYSVPVQPGSAFSVLNNNDWFLAVPLENTGTGQNAGLEMTLEQSLYNGWYYVVSGSLFSSRYKGGDGITRDTRYNKNYILNITAGKEWMLGSTNTDMLGIGIRITAQGGERYLSVNPIASKQAGEVIYDESNPFILQYPSSVYIHLSASYRINTGTSSHEFALKILNATARKEIQGFDINPATGEVQRREELLLLPNLSYKYWF